MAEEYVPPHVARRRAREEAAEESRRRAGRPSQPSFMEQLDEARRNWRQRGRNRTQSAPGATAPAPVGDYEERMQRGSLPPGSSAAPGNMGDYGERAAAGAASRPSTPAPRPRQAAPAARRPRESEADRLNQMELDRIEQDRIDADRRGLAENARRRRETTPERGAEGSGNFFKDLGSFARAITGQSENYKKGGLVKPKGAIIKSKAKSPANLKGKTLMKKGGMAKGGEAGLASGLRGGVVKKPGTDSFNFQAKKMATGGVVEKGGSKYGFTNAKTKMLRRGGMAKGCK